MSISNRDSKEMSLRPYQQDALDACLNNFDGGLCVLPTGSGKSHIIASLAYELRDKEVLIVTPRIELTRQNKEKLHSNATCVTLNTAFHRNMSADVLIIDEAHRTRLHDGMLQTLMKRCQVCYGFTATPYRLDTGHIVPDIFAKVIYEIERQRLVDSGYMVPRRYSLIPNELIINVRQSSFGNSKAMSKDVCPHTAACIRHFLNNVGFAEQGLFFVCDIEHGEKVHTMLPCSQLIHSKLDKVRRKGFVNAFKSGDIQYLINCEILTTGFDHPSLQNIIILRPTDSYSLYEQICGRGDRISLYKTHNKIWDYTICAHSFGVKTKKPDPIKYCLYCMELTDYRLRDCQHCQKKLIRGEAPSKDCRVCGYTNHTVAVYCVDCGAWMKETVNVIRFNKMVYDDGKHVAMFGYSRVEFDTIKATVKNMFTDIRTKWSVVRKCHKKYSFQDLKPSLLYWKYDNRRNAAKLIKITLDKQLVDS